MNNSAIFEERNKIRVCAGSVRADSYGMPFALKAAGERLSGANRIPVARKSDIILKDIVSCKAFIAFVDFLEFLVSADSCIGLRHFCQIARDVNTCHKFEYVSAADFVDISGIATSNAASTASNAAAEVISRVFFLIINYLHYSCAAYGIIFQKAIFGLCIHPDARFVKQHGVF